MEVMIRPGKYPTEWRMEFNSNGWAQGAKAVLRGSERMAGELLTDLLGHENPVPQTADAIMAVLNERLSDVQSRIDDGGEFNRIPEDETLTVGDCLQVTKDTLLAAFWLFASGLESLRRADLALATRAFQRSAEFHGRYAVMADLIEAQIAAQPAGPAHALAARKDQVIKPDWLAHCRAIFESGMEVNYLEDLLNTPGYPAEATRVSAATLRKWARTCGITFKAGRPQRNK